jgi:hypothetical protein
MVGSALFSFSKTKQIMCLLESFVRLKQKINVNKYVLSMQEIVHLNFGGLHKHKYLIAQSFR